MLLLVYSLPDLSFLFFNFRVSASVRGVNHGMIKTYVLWTIGVLQSAPDRRVPPVKLDLLIIHTATGP